MSRAIKQTLDWLNNTQFIEIKDKTDIVATKLGVASVVAGMTPAVALKVYDDLETAKCGLNLETDFHLIYLCTPVRITESPNWTNLADKLLSLKSQQRRVLDMIHSKSQDPYLKRIQRIGKPSNCPEDVLDKFVRFYYALALFDMAEEKPLVQVSAEFKVSTGQLQSIQGQAAQYAGMITSFCEELSWVHMANLLHTFQGLADKVKVGESFFTISYQSRIEYGVHADLLDLVRCSFLNARRARAFYRAGFKTLKSIAEAELGDLTKVLRKMDAFEGSKKKVQLVLPGIKQNLNYHEASEIIKSEAIVLLQNSTPKSADDTKADLMCSFDQTFSETIVRQHKESMAKPRPNLAGKSFITQDSLLSDGQALNRTTTPKLVPLDEQFKSQRKLKRESIEEVTTELHEPKQDENSEDSEKNEESDDCDENLEDDQTPELYMDKETSIASEFSLDFDDSKAETGSVDLFNENDQSIEEPVTEEKRAEKRNISQEDISLPKKPKFDLSDTVARTNDLSLASVERNEAEESFERFFEQPTIRKSKKSPMKTPTKPLSESVSALPKQLSPQAKLAIQQKAEKEKADRQPVRKRLFETMKAARRRDIGANELDKLIVKTLKNREAVVILSDEKCFMCPIQSQSDSVYVVDREFYSQTTSVLKTIICYDLVALVRNLSELFDDDKRYFDVEVLCWYKDTTLTDQRTGRIPLEKAANQFLNQLPETPADKCLLVAKLYRKLVGDIDDFGMNYLVNYEMKHVMLLETMSKRGFPCSSKALESTKTSLERLSKKTINVLDRLIKKKNLGGDFDVTKVPDQKKLISRMLIESGGEPISKLTSEMLESFSADFPIAGQIHNLRRLKKALGDIEIYKTFLTSNDRLHPTINYLNLTGRITMDQPALQMVQKEFHLHSTKPDLKQKSISLRNVFRAPENFVFVAGDYSQLELRILADFSKDEKLINAFNSTDRDPFREVASDWFQKRQNEVTDEERNQVKRALYGIIYGMGVSTLAKNTGVTKEEAQSLMLRYKESHPKMSEYCVRVMGEAEVSGFCTTKSGRRRAFHRKELNRKDERVSVNTTIQGSAADLVKAATVELHQRIQKVYVSDSLKPNLVHHIHDELVYECPKNSVDSFMKLMKDTMTGCDYTNNFTVKFKAKVRQAKSWDML